jgi:membrane protein YdbS with pleckstrin-like domain
MNPTLIGAAKSKTNYLALILLILGAVQANAAAFGAIIDQKWMGLANMLIAVLVIVVRFYTNESLAAKGGGG